MDSLHKGWQRGTFIDGLRYRKWTDVEKNNAENREKLLVRPSPKGNAICQCTNPEHARWIASRLNLASTLEQMAYDFATGKTGGGDIVKLVQDAINNI